ncbi:MAG: B12-binding domain-containing radical SAM protein [bacterium]
MEMKKALLLNPPGDQKYLRDYFCSTISKTGYYWHPIDLLIQSGFLSRRYGVKVIDAIASDMKEKEVIHIISEYKPDVILSMTGVLSYKEDMAFLAKIRSMLPDAHIFAIGEPFLEQPRMFLGRHSFLDGILLSFIHDDITAYMDKRFEDIKMMAFRKGNEILLQYQLEKRGVFSIPLPEHKLFPLKRYWMPFIRHHPFVSVLTTYGCPYTCSFCNSGANSMGFLTRDINEVIDELRHIKRLGIRHVFIKDMTFGIPGRHAMLLCEAMIKERLDITWHCYSRTDVVDDEMLRLMKRAGCSMIQFGVETSNENTLKKYNKVIPLDKTVHAFELAHKYGILTGAHFIFGLPGDNADDIKKTVEFAKYLKPAYVSFNIATPRYGTSLRNELISSGNRDYHVDKGVEEFVKEANMDFYLRPTYLIYLLRHIKNITQFESVLREGIGMIRSLLSA